MTEKKKQGNFLIGSVKGMVILVFLSGCLAFGLAWTINRVAFHEMLSTVKNITSPNQKLHLVNVLYRNITQLNDAHTSTTSQKEFLKQSKAAMLLMDSLRDFYKDRPKQLQQIDSMKAILLERDKLFMNYEYVKQGLVNNKSLSDEMDLVKQLVSGANPQADSMVISSSKKTVKMYSVPDSGRKENSTFKSFWRHLFGKQDKKSIQTAEKIIREETNTNIDTLAKARRDSTSAMIQRAVQSFNRKQRLQQLQFVNKEQQLAATEKALVSKLLNILQHLEKKAVAQAEQDTARAQVVARESINRIFGLILCFLLLTGALLLMILKQVSKTKRYQKKLQLATEEAQYHSEAKQRFLSNMSHEIRTPLQAIIGFAEQVRSEELPDKNNIEAIYSSSEHLLHIVNEVLDYSRIISGKFSFEESAFNIQEQLDEVVRMIDPLTNEKSLELQTDISIMQYAYVKGDAFRLKQILLNLLGNAIKYTETGWIKLSAEMQYSDAYCQVIFKVQDSGKGIEPKDLQTIFNQFERLDKDSGIVRGTGLGLSIVKALVEGQNGTIKVQSEPGKGSCFTVALRLPAADKPVHSVAKHHGAAIDSTRKVWVVDDDVLILQLCSVILGKHKIAHECFSNANDILNAAEEDEAQYILIDIRMPGMNGVELYKRLKQKGIKAKMYAVTAEVLPEEHECFKQSGFDGILTKPFKEQDLLAILCESVLSDACEGEQEMEMLDLSAIEKMVFGNKEMIDQLLIQFIEDTQKDIITLLQSIETKNREKASLLFHRIAGRTAQVGAKEVGLQFRKMEHELKHERLNWSALEHKTENCCLDLLEVVRKVKNRILIQYHI